MEPATILLVDDEAIVRRVLGDALTQAGYRVRLAGNGQTALEEVRLPGIDLMVLDLQLGDLDGVEVMKAARQIWPQLPILILTAHGSLPSAIEAVRYGAADYLLKPVSMELLRNRVAAVLQQQQARHMRDARIKMMYAQLQALMRDEGLFPMTAPGAMDYARPAELDTRVYSSGPLVMDVQQHIVRMHGQTVDLTPTEFAILLELIRQPGVVVPCTRLVQAIQNVSIDEDEARQVMRPHIVRLRRKIESDPQRPVYIQSVRGVGYRWGMEETLY